MPLDLKSVVKVLHLPSAPHVPQPLPHWLLSVHSCTRIYLINQSLVQLARLQVCGRLSCQSQAQVRSKSVCAEGKRSRHFMSTATGSLG